MDKYFETNLKHWNELVSVHTAQNRYNLDDFMKNPNSLHSVELEALGNVTDKTLLHLQLLLIVKSFPHHTCFLFPNNKFLLRTFKN